MKSLLFSTTMVQAIMDGRKTVTRRPIREDRRGEWAAVNDCRNHEYRASVPCYLHRAVCVDDNSRNIMYPKYDVGDILYVRETWRLVDFEYIDGEWSASVQYKDGAKYARLRFGEFGADQKLGWRPSIHMPREAARLFLRVTDVRVERLTTMSNADFLAEGIGELYACRSESGYNFEMYIQFKKLWNSIYYAKGYGWEIDPWVWVVKFEKIEGGEG